MKRLLAALLTAMFTASATFGAELAVITPQNWREFAMQGKEVDFIYGDIVLRNKEIVAVIARPIVGRNANMTVRGVGGCIIDLTQRHRQSDQLSAYYPLSATYPFTDPKLARVKGDGKWIPLEKVKRVNGSSVVFECQSTARADRAHVVQRYKLSDGSRFVVVESVLTNKTKKVIEVQRSDSVRADRTFQFGGAGDRYWFADDWFRQAYGVHAPGYMVRGGKGRARPIRFQHQGKVKKTLKPKQSITLTRRIVPAENQLELNGILSQMAGQKTVPIEVSVSDGNAVFNAQVVLKGKSGKTYGAGRTGVDGRLKFRLPPGDYVATITALGRPPANRTLNASKTKYAIRLQKPGYVRASITDVGGRAIPCKVAFHGKNGTKSPNFGPDSGAIGIGNVHYSHNGEFRQVIGPGKYDVIISRGTEYDAVFRDIEVKRGQTTLVRAKLKRTVDTRGWISADFHSHSSPSGDNTGSQFGRVLSLICEHIEFAPCTEHNRVSSYIPHLQRLGALRLMGTCSGIELTGSPGTINHQNAFPLKLTRRIQDGGGPVTDVDPTVQIRRLAYWDDKSAKLVQGNHPNLIQLLADRDQDGKADGGFKSMLQYMDAIEVHPPAAILSPPTTDEGQRKFPRNTIFHWLQMLNMGYRITGVVNTDAHYNFHESGWLRNYIKSPTDDPSKIKVSDMVEATERANLVMSNGPFMQVTLQHAKSNKKFIPGNDVRVFDKQARLHVRVQCCNWIDINRVQVFFNGRAMKKLNFTRRKSPQRFGNGVVKFDMQIPLTFKSDAHVVVCAAGEGLQLGRIMGPVRGKKMPVAVSNPIFVDVDGGGFKPNGDLLDFTLPPKKRQR